VASAQDGYDTGDAVMQSHPNLCVFIPAYNAEQTLPGVIGRISEQDWKLIRLLSVIDDGSNDGTADYVANLAKENRKIVLFSLSHNEGYGMAVRKGIELCRSIDPDFCVCLHADGQYPPEKIGQFVSFMAKNSIDILQGSRHKGGTALRGNMPFYKYVFGKLLVLIENKVFGLRMTDYHSGYLFYSRRALNTLPLERFSSSFDFDLEVIAAARARRLNIEELAIETRYGDEKSYLNPVTYGLRVLGVLVRYIAGAYDP
jgi:glycosyltransferase involved in cell wall biosynthesis